MYALINKRYARIKRYTLLSKNPIPSSIVILRGKQMLTYFNGIVIVK